MEWRQGWYRNEDVEWRQVGMGMRIWSERQGRYGNEVWSGARYHGNLDMRGVWWEYVVWGQGLYRNE